jgi:hypothetical protein
MLAVHMTRCALTFELGTPRPWSGHGISYTQALDCKAEMPHAVVLAQLLNPEFWLCPNVEGLLEH